MTKVLSVNFRTNDFFLRLDRVSAWTWLRVETINEEKEINVGDLKYQDNNEATTYIVLTEEKAAEANINRSILIAPGYYTVMDPYKIIGFTWCCENEDPPLLILKVKKNSETDES